MENNQIMNNSKIDMASLGYSEKQVKAIQVLAARSNDVPAFPGFATKINASGAEAVQAEMKRRRVRFLPQQVIRRILKSG